MKYLALCFILLGTAGLSAQDLSADLPKDDAFYARVVHKVKYPLAERLSLDFGLAKYYGDRLASSWAYGFEIKYHLSERVWFGVPLYFFQSKPVDGAPTNADGSPMVAIEPRVCHRRGGWL